MPKYIASETPLVAANARLRKKRIGSIGAGARSSQTTKAATRAAPPVSAPRTVALVQPSALARTRPYTTPNRPAPASASPGGRADGGAGDSFSRRAASGTSTSPIGTLSQKIQCQEMPSTTAPPITGPRATPSPLMPDQAPIARPRFSLGNASLSSVSVSGVTIAAPAPWKARAPTSVAVLGATAAAADASVKSARPAMNIRRRPKRSPSAAPVRSSTAKVSV